MWSDVGIDELTDVLINVLTSEMVDIGIDILVDVGIIGAVTPAVIVLDFVVSKSYDSELLIDMRLDPLTSVSADDATIDTASDIGVDRLTGVDTNVLAAVMTFKFIVSTSLSDSAPFC